MITPPLLSDERGAALVETLITFPVFLFSFLGLYMLSFIFAGHVIVMRAADAAARAAIVFMPDDPIYYGDQGVQKEQCVHVATQLALHASPFLQLDNVSFTQARAFDPLSAEVRASFDCSPFLASFMCGLDRKVPLRAATTLPYQAGFPD